MKYTTNKSMRSVNIKITLQTGSPNHPEVTKRIICQKELYQVDAVADLPISSTVPDLELKAFSTFET